MAQSIWNAKPFLAWLGRKKKTGKYNYLDHGNCLLAQYLKSRGYSGVTVCSFGYYSIKQNGKTRNRRYPAAFEAISLHGERTFGAALERARAALSEPAP